MDAAPTNGDAAQQRDGHSPTAGAAWGMTHMTMAELARRRRSRSRQAGCMAVMRIRQCAAYDRVGATATAAGGHAPPATRCLRRLSAKPAAPKCFKRPAILRKGAQGKGVWEALMLKITRLISLAAIAALIVSGSAPAMAAASGHLKKTTHASNPVPRTTATPVTSGYNSPSVSAMPLPLRPFAAAPKRAAAPQSASGAVRTSAAPQSASGAAGTGAAPQSASNPVGNSGRADRSGGRAASF